MASPLAAASRSAESSLATTRMSKRSLSRKIDFDNIRSQGRKLSSNRWLLVIYRNNDLGFLRYGFSLTRKLGSAVTRNRLKRWSREFLKKKIKEGQDLSVDTHFIFRPTDQEFYRNLQFADFEKDLEAMYRKMVVGHTKPTAEAIGQIRAKN